MNALLLSDYFGQTCEGWLASEKIDGIRAIWNGEDLVSRDGLIFNAPDWFKANLPKLALDGELFAGSLGATISAVQSGDWDSLVFHVFDAPSAIPFEERVEFVQSLDLPSHCVKVQHWKTETISAIKSADQIAARGGEGLVVRCPRSPYISGRTMTALKIKPTRSAEMIVIGYHGKGIKGHWNGVTVSVNTKAKPELGDRVTFAFSGTTESGIPRCTSFLAIRNYE